MSLPLGSSEGLVSNRSGSFSNKGLGERAARSCGVERAGDFRLESSGSLGGVTEGRGESWGLHWESNYSALTLST